MSTDFVSAARNLREQIENETDLTERSGTLSPALVDAFADAGLFQLMVPQSLGGGEADCSTCLDVFAEVAYADGSAGWSLMANASSTSYLAYIDPSCAQEIIGGNPRSTVAGMVNPMGGLAHKEAGGFRVAGQYQFGSGCGHATWLGSGALEMHNGEMPPFDDQGLPRSRVYFLPANQVEIQGNWDVLGLNGTGSYDYQVPEQFVEESWTFELFNPQFQSGGALYRLGPTALAGLGHAGWALGVGRRALDEIQSIVEGGRARLGAAALKDQQTFQREFGRHHSALRAATLLAHDSYNRALEHVAAGRPMNKPVLDDTRAATTYATQIAEEAVLFSYRQAGSKGLRNPSVLQRALRDMLTGGRHVFVDDRAFDDVAQNRLAST